VLFYRDIDDLTVYSCMDLDNDANVTLYVLLKVSFDCFLPMLIVLLFNDSVQRLQVLECRLRCGKLTWE